MTRIIFLNQGGGRLFEEFIAEASSIGPAIYFGPSNDSFSINGVHLVKMPRHSNRTTIERLWTWFNFLAISGWKILTTPGKPLLFIVTNPPLSPLLGVIANKLRGNKYILLFYDMYPEALTRFANISENSIITRIWRFMNAMAIRNAVGVITISPQMAETLRQYYPLNNGTKNVRIIPTWVDTEQIRPMDKDQNWFAKRYGQIGKLTILYSGNIGFVHNLNMLPEIAQRLQDYTDVHFLIVGEGSGRKQIEAECVRLKLKNLTLLPLQDEETLPFLLATGDVSIVSLVSGAEGIAMPSKTYYNMAAGCALLGFSNSNSDLAAVIRNYQCGINVETGNVDDVVQQILQIRERPDILNEYRKNARQAAEKYFSRKTCTPKMVEFVRKLM